MAVALSLFNALILSPPLPSPHCLVFVALPLPSMLASPVKCSIYVSKPLYY